MVRDYQLAAQIGTREAWDSFLRRYPEGFYADLARAQRSKLAAFEKDQITRDDQQPPPSPQPERRTALPPPVSCPDGQRLEAGECVADAPPAKYGAIAIGTKGNVWYGVVWARDTEEDAKSAAMSGCINQARKNRSTNCRVVHSFRTNAWRSPGSTPATDGGPRSAIPSPRRKAPRWVNAAAPIRANVACSRDHGAPLADLNDR